jgi:hypothetical protein
MIASAQSLWWLALPVLLLPIWWHRQKRQRIKSEPLATARFLPAAPPQQMRVWRWENLLLLILRCLLLVALIAWVAGVTIPWRGDTVLLDPALAAGKNGAWAEHQIAGAGFGDAQRMPMPADPLRWLQANEAEWRPGARLLIVAGSVPMSAQIPQLAHPLAMRIAPAPSAASSASAPVHHIALAAPPERAAAWRTLFAAFDAAGTGADRYIIEDQPRADTQLIVWDQSTAPPAGWRAPLWWLQPAALPSQGVAAAPQPLRINGLQLQIADSPRGRLWASTAWPPQDAETAMALYETWQALARPIPTYAAPALTLPAQRSAPLSPPATARASWLAYALAALLILERLVTHARRR